MANPSNGNTPFTWAFSQHRKTEALVTPWFNDSSNDGERTYRLTGQLLLDREAVWVHFSRLGLIQQQQWLQDEEAVEHLRSFCQRLMDYAAAGELNLFERMIKEEERFLMNKYDIDQGTLADLRETTYQFLAFNDRFDTFYSQGKRLDTIPKGLSQLSNPLIERERLENLLLHEFYTITQQPPHALYMGQPVKAAASKAPRPTSFQ